MFPGIMFQSFFFLKQTSIYHFKGSLKGGVISLKGKHP